MAVPGNGSVRAARSYDPLHTRSHVLRSNIHNDRKSHNPSALTIQLAAAACFVVEVVR
jgi:hypothetical protein